MNSNWSKSVQKKKQAPKRAPKKPAPLLCCAGDLCKQKKGCIIIGKGHKCAVCQGCMHGFPCSDEKVEDLVGMTCKKCALTGQKGQKGWTSRTARIRTPSSPLSTQTNRRGRHQQNEPKDVAVPKYPLPTRRSTRKSKIGQARTQALFFRNFQHFINITTLIKPVPYYFIDTNQ